MHYIIEVVNKDEPFGDILETMRRAGNPTGKAQAFTLARQLGKVHTENTIFVNEIVSRDEELLVAAYNANDDVKEKYPQIEYLDLPKLNAFEKNFVKEVEEWVNRGHAPGEGCEKVLVRLQEVFNERF